MKFKISLLFLTILLFIAGCSEPSKKNDNSAVIPVEINVDFGYKVNSDMSVNFTSNITGLPENADVIYKWDFNCDEPGTMVSSDINPTHNYTKSGSYKVMLDVIYNNTHYTSPVKIIEIEQTVNISVDFSYTLKSRNVSFNAQISGTTGNENITYKWNFGGEVLETG